MMNTDDGRGGSEHASLATGSRAFYAAGIALVLATVVLVLALAAFRRASLARERRSRVAAVDAGPRVRTMPVLRSAGAHTISLTGEARPFLSTVVYSKVSGYLKEVPVDKGDLVQRGAVLAVVQSPETDQEYEAAVANARNKRQIANADQQLVGRKLIAPEEAATAETDARVAEARAERASTLKGYEVLRAPFSGTVTARYADPGALVQNAENSQTSALPVVAVGTTDSLRVYVYIDQRDAASVRRGTPVRIVDPARPGQTVRAAVARYTGELDPSTRTLLAEIDVSNRRHLIEPGSFVQVTLNVPGSPYYEVPAEALVTRGDKQFVAVVSPENRVTYRQVHVADTDGENVLLVDGVRDGERVAVDLGDSVAEGQHVRTVDDAPAAVQP